MALRTPLSVTPHLYMGDSTGRPLDNGVVYFGEQDKDPEFYPITLYSDDALTKPLAQPVHTKGGYLYNKGDMVEPHAKEIIYSVKVLDSYGRKVFYKGAMMRNSWNDDVIEQINTALVSTAEEAAQIATDVAKEIADKAVISSGFVTIDSFELGATLTQRNQALRHEADSKLYRWAGDLPKIVPASSTPESSGGVAANAWLEVSDTALRQEILTGGLLTDTFVNVTANNGTIARTQRDVNSDKLDLRDFGIAADGVNRTAEIVALMQSFSGDKRAVINASADTRFVAEEVLKAMPVGVSIELNGARSGHYTSTYKQKFYGVLANDAVNDDTVHVVETGHHPAFGLINHRSADKDSSNGAASILYGLGRVRGGAQRNMALQQWVKNPTGKWNWSIRAYAPWEAVDDKDDMFQPWAANETIKVGDYRLYKAQMYKAASSGITGATPPTHLEGDVAADDGITWKHVFRGDTTTIAVDETGSFAVNGTPSSIEQVIFNQSVNDTYQFYSMGINAKGKNKTVSLRFTPTDSDGAAASAPTFNATPDGELSIITSGQATSVCSFNGNSATLKAVNYTSLLAAQGSETPSVSNASSLVINNSTATTITNLLGAVSNQCVTLLFANANTTLKHNTNIRLQDSVDVTPTALSVITLQKFKAGSLTPAWIEVSRSIK